jgi:D-arabinose 1-dehydrogenase-like Zn-dependent alcohol dehydrogenase
VNCERQPMSGVHTDGGYAEMMIAKANALAAIPDELNPVEAAPLPCAGLTTFNALRKSKASAGDLVAHSRRRRLGTPGNSVCQVHGVQGRRDLAWRGETRSRPDH